MATTGFDRLNMSIFKGSMVAIATPMNLDGSLDFDSLYNLIEFHVKNNLDLMIEIIRMMLSTL